MLATPRLRRQAVPTCSFEALGLACATSVFVALSGGRTWNEMALVLAILAAAIIWTPLHRFVFDRLEARKIGRATRDWTVALRLVHDVFHEVARLGMIMPLAVTLVRMAAGLQLIYVVCAAVVCVACAMQRLVRS